MSDLRPCPRCKKPCDPLRFGNLFRENEHFISRYGFADWRPVNPEPVCFSCWDIEWEKNRHAAHDAATLEDPF